MKQKKVDPKIYSSTYFSQLDKINYLKKISDSDFPKKYKEVFELFYLEKINKVIDYGCGTGIMCFYFALKQIPEIIGYDYSPDAINLARGNLTKFFKKNKTISKLNFYKVNTHLIPPQSTDVILLLDVIEHLYPAEVDALFIHIKKNFSNATIIIHTDNNLYLNFVRPILDTIAIFLRQNSLKKIQERKKMENSWHVNLTNPHSLNKTLSKLGFVETNRFYPKVSDSIIQNQLKNTGLDYLLLTKLVYFLLPFFKFFSPSFYASYKSSN